VELSNGFSGGFSGGNCGKVWGCIKFEKTVDKFI